MASRETLHEIVAALPEALLDDAERALRHCATAQASANGDLFDPDALIAKYGYEDEVLSPAELAVLADIRAGRRGRSVILTEEQMDDLLAGRVGSPFG